MSERPGRWQRWRLPVLSLLAIVLVGAVAVWLYRLLGEAEQPKKKKVMQEIALVKPPPPPPPPKTPPPPPKEMIKEKIDVPKPDDAPAKPSEAPPPGPDLAVDAAGTSGGDNFGLVGKKGGTDLLASGGGIGNKFAWYGALVKDRIQDAIVKDKTLRDARDFQRNVNVWVNASGQVTRVEILGVTDNTDLDNVLRAVLKALQPLREGAPPDMPQPIRMRIAAR